MNDRDEIASLLYKGRNPGRDWADEFDWIRDAYREYADEFLEVIKQANYVQLDDDQSYPPIPRKDIAHIIMQRDSHLREANFRKVK